MLAVLRLRLHEITSLVERIDAGRRLERVLESEGSVLPTFVLIGVCCVLLASGWTL